MACPTQNITSRARLELTGFRVAVAITHTVGHGTFTLKNLAREASEVLDQTFSHEACISDRTLQLRIATPLIIVHLASPNPFRQAEEVVQHVPIVGAQRRGKGAFQPASVNLIAHPIQKCAALSRTSLTAIFNEGVDMSEPFP